MKIIIEVQSDSEEDKIRHYVEEFCKNNFQNKAKITIEAEENA